MGTAAVANQFTPNYSSGVHTSDVLHDLDKRVQELEDYIKWDEELRKLSPALQDLYDKYQATKKLIK